MLLLMRIISLYAKGYTPKMHQVMGWVSGSSLSHTCTRLFLSFLFFLMHEFAFSYLNVFSWDLRFMALEL